MELNTSNFISNMVPMTELLFKMGVIKGHAELRRLIVLNAIKVNGEPITKIDQTIDILANRNIVVEVGKKNKYTLTIV